jgi:peptide-methionine (S)-S-oxide reductase
MTEKKKATFAAGCFWGVESSFRQLDGVIDVTVGYTGGRIKNPTYEMVCSDRSGHAEAVEVEYDPSVVSYDTLLDVFWEIHDPTSMNRQGPDFGTQYRSAIFYHDESQRRAAEASIKRAAPLFEDPIVTEITPASEFYPAEEYHQRYYERMGLPNLCAIHAGGRK